MALVGAVGLCIFIVLLLSDCLDLDCLNLCCVLVDEPKVGLSIIRHLEQKMEQVIVYAHICLLVVDLVNFNGDVRLRNRQFHLLPDLKCSV